MSSLTHRSPHAAAAAVAGAAATALFALAAVAGCGGPDGVDGTLRTADTKGKAGVVMSGGWVGVLTADQASDFWTQTGLDRPDANDLAFAQGRVRHEAVTDAGGQLVSVDDKGKFTVRMTGPHQLCVLREFPQVDVLRGCATVDLPASGELDLTVGDDGVQAKLHG